MSTTQTYKVIRNNAPVKNRPSLFASTLGKLKRDTLVEIISISGIWAYFKYKNKNAYILTYYLEKVEAAITGSMIIRYLNVDTNEEISPSTTNNSLELKSYSYTAPSFNNYTIIEPSTISVTLTSSSPNQEIIFYYKENKIYGNVIVNCLDKDSKEYISDSNTYQNLELGSYTYTAPEIKGYKLTNESSVSVTLTKESPDMTITFEYIQILGSVTVKYIDVDTQIEIDKSDIYSNLPIGSYTYESKSIDGYTLVSSNSQAVNLTYDNFEQEVIFKYKKDPDEDPIYTIDLAKYDISNDNSNATDTTKGINQALVDAKANGYKRVKLPEGHYAIDTSVKNPIVLSDSTNSWTHHRQGISMQSDMELILENSILQMIPCEDPYYSILTISDCKNSKVTGGTILGDRETHDYGMRINNNGSEFELGNIDIETGELIKSDNTIRTVNYIDRYIDWFTKEENILPNTFNFCPLWNTTKNTVDGGKKIVYCYDNDNNFLGICGNNGFGSSTLIEGTKKIKLTILNEARLDAVVSITKRMLYASYEFGSGITLGASDTIEIDGTTVKNCIGDCICTLDLPLNLTVDNINIIGCELSNSRRQGISFVATGENYLIKNCKIHSINGVDPQAGIDIEHYNYIKNVTIDSNTFYNNRKLDIINYNGTSGIEIKNNTFNGAVGNTFANNTLIHDNTFLYEKGINDNLMLVKDCSLVLFNENNISYNNRLTNCRYNLSNTSISYSNTIINGTVNISSIQDKNTIADKFYNSTINFTKTKNKYVYENYYFENCNLGCNNNDYNIEVIKSSFNNSDFNLRGKATVTDSTFELIDKPLMYGWKVNNTDIYFNSCIINSSDYFIQPGSKPIKLTFNDCIIKISRKQLWLYTSIVTFNNCHFIFNDIEDGKTPWNTYSGDAEIWYFNNCIFESNFPIKIRGEIINPTLIGNVTII